MLINKDQIPLVAVDSMNQTHMDEVDLINRLHELLQQHQTGAGDDAAVSAALDAFETHVVEHFAAEEQLMLETGFPAYPVHRGEHERVLAALRDLLRVYREAGNLRPFADYLENGHLHWAYNHIATMDTMTAFFIARARPHLKAAS
jgi:hemerythrin